MTELSSLLLPILLSAVFVFIASSIIHMATPWHAGDYRRVPNEDAVAASLRAHAVPPGDYMMPRPASMKEMSSPEFIEKRRQGPVMVFTMMPSGTMSMTSNLVQWFVYLLAVGLFTAYVAGLALGRGAEYMPVFRLVGATAFMGYALALAQMSVWYRRNWGTTLRSMVDGLVYALITAGVFGWLWPT
jgi:hypothetical protein